MQCLLYTRHFIYRRNKWMFKPSPSKLCLNSLNDTRAQNFACLFVFSVKWNSPRGTCMNPIQSLKTQIYGRAPKSIKNMVMFKKNKKREQHEKTLPAKSSLLAVENAEIWVCNGNEAMIIWAKTQFAWEWIRKCPGTSETWKIWGPVERAHIARRTPLTNLPVTRHNPFLDDIRDVL